MTFRCPRNLDAQHNTYTYVNGDPINLDDPTGHHPAYDYSCGTLACQDRGDEEAAATQMLAQVRPVISLARQVSGLAEDGQTANPVQMLRDLTDTYSQYISCLYSQGFGGTRSQNHFAENRCQSGLGAAGNLARLDIQSYLDSTTDGYAIMTNLGAVRSYLSQSGLADTPVTSKSQYESLGAIASVGVTDAVEGADVGASASQVAAALSNPVPDGVVYLRTSTLGSKPYIGQAQSMERFVQRISEHAAANPQEDFEFDIIGRADPGTPLDRLENYFIRIAGGPTTQMMPDNLLANKRFQLSELRYIAAGGDPAADEPGIMFGDPVDPVGAGEPFGEGGIPDV